MESWFKWTYLEQFSQCLLDQDDMFCVTKQIPDADDATKNTPHNSFRVQRSVS